MYGIDLGDYISINGEAVGFVTLVEGSVLSFLRWRWWHRVIAWNPCNNLGHLYYGQTHTETITHA